MQFDVIIGNPPYQQIDNNAGKGSAKPLYHLFISQAKKLGAKLLSFIIPSVWFKGGKGLNEFRGEMLADPHLKEIVNFTTSQDLFPNVNLRGGVNYFLWDNSYDNANLIEMSQYTRNKLDYKQMRILKLDQVDILISDIYGLNIVKRFLATNVLVEGNLFMDIISSRNPYNFTTTFEKNNTAYDESEKHLLQRPVKIYLSRDKHLYVEQDLVQKKVNTINSWRVITPFANNIGTNLEDDNLNSKIAEPGSIVSETYLVIGEGLELTESMCFNIQKYLKTKFVRFLISLAKANQNGTKVTYRFVPMQDFSYQADIDWSKDITTIDDQLFQKYSFTPEEIEHINKVIKAMR